MLAGILLLFAGLMAVISAIAVLVIGAQGTSILEDIQGVTKENLDLIRDYKGVLIAGGGVLLAVGLIHLLASIGIFGHRGWGRFLGLLLGLLGVLIGIAGVVSANNPPMSIDGRTVDLKQNLSPSIGFLVFYAIIFLGLLIGRGQFRLKQVDEGP